MQEAITKRLGKIGGGPIFHLHVNFVSWKLSKRAKW